jgi:glycosyltransferase involved in cell wall biosynthesis
MKVVHVISGDLWAGAEAQAYSLIRELSADTRVELAAIVLNEGQLATRLRELGIRVHVINEQHKGPVRILHEMRSLLRAEQPEVLHSHRYKENIIGAFASRPLQRVRRVKTLHGLPESAAAENRLRGRLTGALDRFVTRRYFDRVICVSEHMMKHLVEPFGSSKLVCIRNGIDATTCRPRADRDTTRRKLGLPADAPVVGTAARLVRVKGLDYLLQAAAALRNSLPHLSTLIVGDGPEMAHLKSLAKELGMAERVMFTGHRDDVYDLMAAMDVFVLPSLSEGIPMVLLEAMALGTPIVASRVGGVPEIVEHEATGLLLPPGDPTALSDSCLRVISDQNLADALRTRAREKVVREHSAALMAQQVFALYQELLS